MPRTVRHLAVLAVLAAVLVGLALVLPPLTERFHAWDGGSFLGDVVKGWSLTVLHPAYWAVLLVVGLLELRWPARRGEGLFTVGGAQDLVWLLLAPLFALTIVAGYVALLQRLYEGPLGGAALDVDGTLGGVAAFVLAFLLADFFMWFSHFVRHKVPTLWRFHQVHHSQRMMSMLTDNRVHFFEAMVSATIAYVPARLLGLSNEAAVAIAFLTVYFTGFTHANLRTNLGPARYLVVTPQSHRPPLHRGAALGPQLRRGPQHLGPAVPDPVEGGRRVPDDRHPRPRVPARAGLATHPGDPDLRPAAALPVPRGARRPATLIRRRGQRRARAGERAPRTGRRR